MVIRSVVGNNWIIVDNSTHIFRKFLIFEVNGVPVVQKTGHSANDGPVSVIATEIFRHVI